jgi:hypothetical protein
LISFYASSAASTEVYGASLSTLTENTAVSTISIFLYTRKQMAVNTSALSMVAGTSTTYVSQQLFFPRS